MNYLPAFLMSLGLSLVLTPLMRWLAIRAKKFDKPDARKVHSNPVPRVGGLAITLAFLIPFLINLDLNRQFAGLLGGVVILAGVGLFDDIWGLKARYKLAWQVLSAVVVLAGGIGIVYFTNPLGGVLTLDFWRIPVEFGALRFNILPLANFVSVIWIVGMVNTLNFLDGLDGLATGVATIAALVLFVMALSPTIANPVVALLAVILVGALLGFLPYNFFPSSIFMGDNGAYVIGLLLALLSIYAGSKIAVGALVLSIAIMDAILTVLRRVRQKGSPFKPDRSHLHHQLLDSGILTHRQVVLFLYAMTVLLAASLLFGNAVLGLVILLCLLVLTVSIGRIAGAGAGGRRVN